MDAVLLRGCLYKERSQVFATVGSGDDRDGAITSIQLSVRSTLLADPTLYVVKRSRPAGWCTKSRSAESTGDPAY